MSDKKQIEEMAKDVWKASCAGHGIECTKCKYANNSTDEYSCVDFVISQNLYNADYRKQKWISVEERLPEVGTRVVGYDYKSNVCCYFITEGRWWIDDGWNTAKGWGITHWMPLPEPPKGGVE